MKRNPFSLAVFLTLTASLALSSESVRFTTTVPAPYGFYNQLITRDKAILARDSGRVGIGTSNPQAALDIVSTTAGFLPPRMSTSQGGMGGRMALVDWY